MAEHGAVDNLLTKQELAERLKKTVRTVEDWQRRGLIPFIKAGHSVLFAWCDVQEHLRRHFSVCRVPATPARPQQQQQPSRAARQFPRPRRPGDSQRNNSSKKGNSQL